MTWTEDPPRVCGGGAARRGNNIARIRTLNFFDATLHFDPTLHLVAYTWLWRHVRTHTTVELTSDTRWQYNT